MACWTDHDDRPSGATPWDEPAGGHTVTIGRVIGIPDDLGGEHPLVYVDRGYRTSGLPVA
jgi:hypothetical protein